MEELNIALIHSDVRYGDPASNRFRLEALNREAAEKGARIILNTEMAVSGYGFRSREEIAPYVESQEGPTLRLLAQIADRYDCYIMAGYAEEADDTGVYYNAAAVLGPDGKLLLNYRKITAEARWACAGSPGQSNVFDTPWGRIGVAICSDTYYGAVARMSALRGVDLLLVPANWPGGSIDPRELWRVRARENGFFVAACNRTGKDRTMVCDDAFSCVYDARGNTVFERSSLSSTAFHVSLPLIGGRLPTERTSRLRQRVPETYTPIYLNMRYAADLTSYYELPEPGLLRVVCRPLPFAGGLSERFLHSMVADRMGSSSPMLVVLSMTEVPRFCESAALMASFAKKMQIALCVGVPRDGGEELLCLNRHGKLFRRVPGSQDFCLLDLDNVRISLASREELYHPETTLALSKLGCDLVVSPAASLEAMDRSVLGSRSIEQVALAVCGSNSALICLPPEDHFRWQECYQKGEQGCSSEIDVSRLRKKQFYDRLDFDLLLAKHADPVSLCGSLNQSRYRI